MFYRATSTVERVIKGIAEFLEHTPMKEWDKESKVFHEWNFLRTEIEENYKKAKENIALLNVSTNTQTIHSQLLIKRI